MTLTAKCYCQGVQGQGKIQSSALEVEHGHTAHLRFDANVAELHRYAVLVAT